MDTVLITGCSSGYGLETARYFLDRDWNVIATMRTPSDVLPPAPRLRVLPLDVTDPERIRRTLEAAGPIDVLVNNAGIGLISAFESTSLETVREIFETNTFGTMALVRAVLPEFRERKSGVIVNVTSTVTLRPLLLLSVYTASKAAINAFTESLALELETFNIRVRLVLPGASSETRFGEMLDRAWATVHRNRMPRSRKGSLQGCPSRIRLRERTMSPKRYGVQQPIHRHRCAFPPALMRSRWLRRLSERIGATTVM